MSLLPATRRGRLLALIAAVLIVAVTVVLALAFRALLVPWLIALVATAALWFLGDLWLRARARRKQAAFDAAIAAKEGIEDRRREWATWTAELARQGIDRDALPFYVLVGEPQSGKSVLLQNSDLHFPFGQNRLSGVGGTKGCDWWFTDQAVILDLAGRLFTHEGGASDEAEWAAFLELLASYRPMCPANGILLVLPCDGLLKDAPEVARQKASRMQAALGTLVRKLEVQLPVYVLLTKGDKVFGFAESVHRLEAEKRHEMFGWSRSAEKLDAPFDLAEARAGFATLLERARGLRAAMLATERVPEALPAIDRLYAFPDELAQLQGNLELYLRQLFTDSEHVAKLFFRGFYLTSGLQSGAPIVKACATLLGGDPGAREADARVLESLIAKQKAYFIKDVVRRRVFEERGIVRPTAKRAATARRSALIGYGAGGTIAAAAIAGIAHYAPASKADLAVYEGAARRTAEFLRPDGATLAPADGELAEVMTVLRDLRDCATRSRHPLETALPFGLAGSKDDFERAYVAVFDRALPKALRRTAERGLVARLAAWRAQPGDHAGLRELLAQARLLQGAGDWSAAGIAAYAKLAAADPRGQPLPLALADAVQGYVVAGGDGLPELPPQLTGGSGRSAELAAAEKETLAELERAFDFDAPCALDGEAGRFAAWVQADQLHDQFTRDPLRSGWPARDRARYFRVLIERIGGAPLADPASEQPLRATAALTDSLRDLVVGRDAFARAAGLPPEPWAAAAPVVAEAKKRFDIDCSKEKGLLGALEGVAKADVRVELPLPHLAAAKGDLATAREFLAACEPALLPAPGEPRTALAAPLAAAATRFAAPLAAAAPAGAVVLARVNELMADDLARFPAADPAAALRSVAPLLAQETTALPTVIHLVQLAVALHRYPAGRFTPWRAALEAQLVAALQVAQGEIDGALAQEPWLDGASLAALDELRQRPADDPGLTVGAALQESAATTRATYLDRSLARMATRLRDAPIERRRAELPRLLGAVDALARSPGRIDANALATFDGAAADALAALRADAQTAWAVDPALLDRRTTLSELPLRLELLLGVPALKERRDRLLASPLARDGAAPLRALAAKPLVSERFTRLPLQAKALADVLAPDGADALANRAPIAALRRFATALGEFSSRGKAGRDSFVAAWRDLEPPASAADALDLDPALHFARSMVAALDLRLLPELRQWFVDEFTSRFLEEPGLLGVRKRLLLGGGSATVSSEDVAELARWFDRGGELDLLRGRYPLAPPPGRTLWPPEGSSSDGEPGALAWATWQFCTQLQEFLLAGGKKTLAEASFAVALELADFASDSGWTLAGASGAEASEVISFAVWIDATDATSAKLFTIDSQLERSPTARARKLEWACAPARQPGLALLWSAAARPQRSELANAGGQESYAKQFHGPLGLLQACWELGQPIAPGRWRLAPQFPRAAPKVLPLRFPFELTFDAAAPPLPLLPAALRAHDAR